MRWAKYVIAPLLAVLSPQDAMSFAGQSSSSLKWLSRHRVGNRHGFGGLISAEGDRGVVGCGSRQLATTTTTGGDDAPATSTPVMASRTAAVANVTPFFATRYTIDVEVHPDVARVAVKHARLLPRFLQHHPISSHTEAAYGCAIDFVREFHRSQHGPPGGDDTAKLQCQKEKGGAKRDVKPPSYLPQGHQHGHRLPVVLDSGCGTGRSSILLAKSHPHLPVIGIDRSAVRLSKARGATEKGTFERGRQHDNSSTQVDDENASSFIRKHHDGNRRRGSLPENLLLLRADLVDLWILASRDNAWEVKEHSILYPNPYPKRSQLRSRWHGHSVFPILLGLGGEIRLRSNWKSYLDEVCKAVLAINHEAERTKGRGSSVVDEGAVGWWERTGLSGGEEDGPGEGGTMGAAVPRLGPGIPTSIRATGNDGKAVTNGGVDVAISRTLVGRDTTATVVPVPVMEIPAAVAAAAASYAASARKGPSLYVPALPAATNFEAKYVTVGETVYELRLQPQLS